MTQKIFMVSGRKCTGNVGGCAGVNHKLLLANMERRITQFADHKFIGVLERHGVRISMDGKGRCMDNIFIERLWRSVKYEEMYCGAESRGLRAS